MMSIFAALEIAYLIFCLKSICSLFEQTGAVKKVLVFDVFFLVLPIAILALYIIVK